MRQLLSLILMSAFVSVANANVNVTVVDETDNSPIIGATVIDKAGIIIGITNNDGQISVSNAKSMPLTIHCIGYEPITSSETDTIKLSSSSYQLNEVVFDPKDRPIKRVILFVREYCSGVIDSDTLQYYNEHMAEAFLTEEKVKGYKKSDARAKSKGYKRYGRIVNAGNDSIFIPDKSDIIKYLSMSNNISIMPKEKIELTEKLKNGAEMDTTYFRDNHDFPDYTYKKKKNHLTTSHDILLSLNGGETISLSALKILGLTMDIMAWKESRTFADNGTYTYGINDLISGANTTHLLLRGKWFRKHFKTEKPVDAYSYYEVYPLEITNCTVQEYKEMRKDRSELPFKYPEGLQPLSPAVQELVDRIEAL